MVAKFSKEFITHLWLKKSQALINLGLEESSLGPIHNN